MKNSLILATTVIVAGYLTGCKQKVYIGNSSRVLEFSQQATAIDIPSTEAAWNHFDSNGLLNGGAGGSKAGLGLDGGVKDETARLSAVNGKTAIIVFGYDKAEAAQLKAKIVPCTELPGAPGGFPWPAGEQCLLPLGVGETGQLAFLSCGSIETQTSCDSVNELMRLMGRTFVTPKAKGVGLADPSNPFTVDTDWDEVGSVSGDTGTFEFNSQAGNVSYDGAATTYKAISGGLGLSDGGPFDQMVKFIAGKNEGMVGYYEETEAGGGSSFGGDPNGAINESQAGLRLQSEGFKPPIGGNVKFFLSKDGG